MKNSIFTIAFLITFIGTTFANNGDNKGDSLSNNKQELSIEQQDLLHQLEKELTVKIDIETLLSEIEASEIHINKVVVYNTQGDIIHQQAGDIEFDKLPKGANALMTDGNTRYYLTK